MLFKNLNNFTLEERVLYLQDKTKEITDWITVHGGNSEDIHKTIEEQIRQIITDKDLDHSQITARLDNIDDELSTIKARLEEIDAAYKKADQTIQIAFSTQITGLSVSFSRQIDTKQPKLYLHTLRVNFSPNVTNGLLDKFYVKILDTDPNPYSSLANIDSKNVLHSQMLSTDPYYAFVFDSISDNGIYFHDLTYFTGNGVGSTYTIRRAIIQSFNDTVTQL